MRGNPLICPKARTAKHTGGILNSICQFQKLGGGVHIAFDLFVSYTACQQMAPMDKWLRSLIYGALIRSVAYSK